MALIVIAGLVICYYRIHLKQGARTERMVLLIIQAFTVRSDLCVATSNLFKDRYPRVLPNRFLAN